MGAGQDSQLFVGISGMLIGVTKVPKHPSEVLPTLETKGSVEVALTVLKEKLFHENLHL